MKTRKISRFLAVALSIIMVIGAMPLSAMAYNASYESETHTVFRHTVSTLAPGVEYYNNYAYLNDGEQIVYYVAVADINRDDVLVQGSYWNAQAEQWGMAKLTEQIASANAKYSDPSNADFISEYYQVVAGTNGDFYNMQTGRPSGAFAIHGVLTSTKANNRPWFAVFEDGTALCGSNDAEWDAAVNAHGAVQEAVGGSQMLVVNGADVTANASGTYNTDRHSRTCIGVTADNKVVCMVLDGRQSPFSDGGSMHELAQIMLEAECVTAINLDGGGSTTFAARPEGEDSVRVINRPSDGSERSISSGVIIASLAAPSNVFDHAVMTAEDEYITPGTSTTVKASGVSPAGTFAEIPANATFTATLGTVDANGVFTSDGTVGDAVISMMLDGNEVGSATVHVVMPDSIAFSNATITVPFSKTVDIEITAKYGLNEVKTKPSDFVFRLAEPAVGTFNGITFTAAGDDAAVTESDVTVMLAGNAALTASARIVLGRASVVLWDFEDGTTGKWVRYNTSNYNYIHTRGTTSNVTAENGQVHSGEHALRVEAKFSETWEAGYVSGRLGVSGLDSTIDLKGATRLGMWVYLPIEAKSFNGRMFLCKVTERDDDGNIANYQGYYTCTMIDQGSDWNCGFITQYNEPGWHYVYFDLNTGDDYCIIPNATLLDFYINDRNGDSYGYNHLNYTSQNPDIVLYVDDVTVDYSSVVEDRDAPVFSSVLLGDRGPHSNDAMTLTDGYVSEGFSQLSLSARVADYTGNSNYTGLDAATAKAYIDGNEIPCTYNNGLISADEYDFTDGKHTVKFSICDKQGNYASAIRTFTVETEANRPTVRIVPHDDTLDRILLGSLYYVDVVASNAELVDTVSLDLNLNNLSVWELDHMEPAEGFTATYEIIDQDDKIARVQITRTGDSELTGEQALVSMPIRTWELPAVAANYGHAGVVWMYPQYRAGNEVWPVDIEVNVARGTVTYTDDSVDFFTGEGVQVDTESIYWDNDNAKASDPYYTSWNGGHDHRAETAQYYADGTTNHVDAVPVEDLAPTCTTDGYTGRTYCEVCHSIVDWGTVVPATGHTYEIIDGVLKCKDCGEVFNGVFEDGKLYVDGIPANGWIEDSYYVDGEMLTGIQMVDGYYYDFGDDGISRGKYTGLITIDGSNYFSKLGVLTGGWAEIDGDWYYFDEETLTTVSEKTFVFTVPITYQFDSDGKIISGVWKKVGAGTRYYYGPAFYKLNAARGNALWVEIDGNTYAFDGMGYRHEGISFIIESNHPRELYEFTDEGVLIGKYTGLYENIYYTEGKQGGYNGILKVDDDYYYIKSNGTLFVGKIGVTEAAAHGYVPAGTYEFGDDGKMIVKNGIVDGYYYENGVLVKGAGIVEIDGDYYYITESGRFYVGSISVSTAKANGLITPGSHKFGDDGKMILRNGLVDGYYYENDVLAKGAGLIKIDDDYYYISNNGHYYVGSISIGTAKTNGLLPAGPYTFGDDGKMLNPTGKNGIVDGAYYIDNVLQKGAGVILWEGDYYYITASGKYYVGRISIGTAKTNGLIPGGSYEFGNDGKMIQ